MPPVSITSPVGRIVMGSLYKPNDKDAEGKPLVVKNGPNAGQPRSQYFIALAIPKGPEATFWETDWGKQILAVAYADFPEAYKAPAFAWKVDDGDTALNKKGQLKWAEREGCAGHWIVKLSGGYAPKVYRMDGNDPVIESTVDFVKPGYYVQALFSVSGNGSQQQPGVYLNLQMVCLRGYGAEIVSGPDVSAAGFGQAALPAGASSIPLAGAVPPPPGAPSLPTGVGTVAPPVPTATNVPPAPPLAAPTSPSNPLPVVPNTQFLRVPPPNPSVAAPITGAAAVPSPGPIAPAPPIPTSPSRMTAKAGNATYEQYIGSGWTDAMLIQQGMMTV